MRNVTLNAKQKAVLGLKSGGQIPLPVIDSYAVDALNKLFADTEMVVQKLTPISEIQGETEYTMPDMIVGNFCRLHSVKRVTYDADGEVSTQLTLPPERYCQGLIVPEDGSSPYEAFKLADASPSDLVAGLLLYAVVSFGSDAYIPMLHTDDSIEAISSKLKEMLMEETGKPWSDTQKALSEAASYEKAVSRIRNKVIRGGTSAGLKMRSTQSFT